MRFGAAFWVNRCSWPDLREAVLLAERSGWDSVWIDDHLLADEGDSGDPKFEGWSTLAAVAALTSTATLGLMVAANTFRNPGLTAKLATTLDHLSQGRAVLGIGGAWFEREHEAFGFDFGSGFGERLDRLDESVMLLRRLLDGERIAEHEGATYRMRDALVEPRPVQRRLPIMIGGSGPKKTLRTLARYGDQWNGMGLPAKLAERDAILREHCATIGRDHEEIERTTTVDIVIRRDRATGLEAYKSILAASHQEYDETWNHFVGTPAEIAEGLQPIIALGFRHLFLDTPAPYDPETL